MTQTTTTRTPLWCNVYGKDTLQWECAKEMAKADCWPTEPGIHLLEFYDKYTGTAAQQMERAIDRMQKTRANFKILNVTAQPRYKAILIQHDGYLPDSVLFPGQD